MYGKLILVRHGQSTYNEENRFTGGKDVDLTQKGVNEAISAAPLLSKYPIDYYGFIFYKKSPRYILNNPDHFFIKNIKNKVAVFVNEDIIVTLVGVIL